MIKRFLSILLSIGLAGCVDNSSSELELFKKAQEIHSRIVSIDTHTDTPLMFTRAGFDFSGESKESRGKIDIKKMEQGKLDAAFFAVFIGQGERTEEKYIEAHAKALEIFANVDSTIQKYPEKVSMATNSSDAARIKIENKKAIYIGVENGYPLGKDLSKIEQYYKLGARYLTLCHTSNNDICDSSTDEKGSEHGGLSPFGKEVVIELNRLGMMIDISHISDDAFYQTVELSEVPVIASHSCTRAICDNPRNLTDDMIVKLAEKGGVIQMCLLSSYVKTPAPYPQRDSARNELRKKYNNFQELSPDMRRKAIDEWYALDEVFPPKLANVSDLVDHIDHVVNLVGIDYVGIGSDFDGGGALEDCYDASQMINITVELLKRGYKENDIEKIWGGNFMRVFKQVEKLAEIQAKV